jgi:hypothetical protein
LNRILALPAKHEAHLRHYQTSEDGTYYEADAVESGSVDERMGKKYAQNPEAGAKQ